MEERQSAIKDRAVQQQRRADTMARAAEQQAEREREREEMDARRSSGPYMAAGGLVKKKNKRRNGKGLARR